MVDDHQLAAWIIGTYFCHVFAAFPFLHIFGQKVTGKSKALEALTLGMYQRLEREGYNGGGPGRYGRRNAGHGSHRPGREAEK